MKNYEVALLEIDEEFRKGYGVTHILSRLGFPSRTLLPVVIAEVDGRLADALSGMAIHMKKTEEAQKKLKNLLAYPTVLFIFITLLLLAFRSFFYRTWKHLLCLERMEMKDSSHLFPCCYQKFRT